MSLSIEKVLPLLVGLRDAILVLLHPWTVTVSTASNTEQSKITIACICLQGVIALLSNSAFMLALHAILGAMLGAALAAHIEGVFNQQEFK